MSERKYTNFLPKWAREGRWEMGEFPNIGEPDEPDEASERNPLTDFIEEQRADRAAFEAEIREKLQALDQHNRVAWFYGAVGWIAAVILAVILAEVTR